MPSFKSPDISLAIAFSIVLFDIYKKTTRSTEVLSEILLDDKIWQLGDYPILPPPEKTNCSYDFNASSNLNH